MSDMKQRGFAARALLKIISLFVTLAVAAGCAVAVVFGAQALANRADEAPVPEPAALAQVAVAPLVQEEGYSVQRQYVGQTEAGATVDLSFELGGRLVELLAEEGDKIKAGDVVMRLDTALLDADQVRLTASRAAIASQLEFAQSRLARAERLRTDGFTSQETLDQVRANRDELQSRMDEIDASLASVTINLEKSVLTAPFDGRVGSQFVEEGVALGAGQSVAQLIEMGRVQVRIGLPLDLPRDALDGAEINIGAQSFPANLIQLRPDIDPVTRTRTAVFSVAVEDTSDAVFGQIAVLTLQENVPLTGAWVQVDALQEGAGGAWTILVVEDDTVRPALVDVLHAESKRAFVRGTFGDGAMIISEGAHRVVPGQTVQVIAAGGV